MSEPPDSSETRRQYQSIAGPAEIVARFDDAGNAAAAKANAEIFLRWSLTSEPGKPPPPPVILVLTQAKLDPEEDRLRRSDWPGMPEVRLAGTTVRIDAPRSQHARTVLRKVLLNSRPTSFAVEPKAGGGAGSRRFLLALLLLVLAAAAGAAAFWFFNVRGGGG